MTELAVSSSDNFHSSCAIDMHELTAAELQYVAGGEEVSVQAKLI